MVKVCNLYNSKVLLVFLIGLLGLILCPAYVNAACNPGHSVGQIEAGTFGSDGCGGNYIFPAYLTVGNQISVSSGWITTTGYTFSGDGDTGMYSSDDGILQFYNDGGETIHINAGTGGCPRCVGIGTASPSQKLDVAGNINFETSALRYLYLGSGGGYLKTGNAAGSGILLEAGNSPGVYINSVSNKPVILATGGGSSNVGIGTAGPDAKLHVIGSICAESSDTGCAPTSGYVRGAGLCIGTDCKTSWPSGVGGSGTANYLSKWTAGTTLGNSLVYETVASPNWVDIGPDGSTTNLIVKGTLFIDAPGSDEISIESLSGETGMLTFTDQWNRLEYTYGSGGPLKIRGYNGLQMYNYAGEVARFGKSSSDLSSYFNGNVGIGTTSPHGKLELYDAAQPTGHDLILSRFWGGTDNVRGSSVFHYYDATSKDILVFGVAGDIAGGGASYTSPNTLAAARMVIQPSGNVGIGTTSPSELLTVRGATPAIALVNSADGDGAQRFKSISGGVSITSDVGDSTFHIRRTTGYVGIGTTGPTAKLFVRETTATTNAGITAGVVSAYSTGDMAQGFGAGLRFNIADSGASNEIAGIYGVRSNADNKGDLALVTNYLGTWYRRMRIGSEGFVFMRDGDPGTYSPASNYYLEVEKDTAGSGAIIGLSSAGTAIRGVTTTGYGVDAATNGAGYALRADGMNTGYAAVFVNGNVGIQVSAPTQKLDVAGNIKTSGCLYYNGGTLGTCASDVYLKTNISLLTFDNALEKAVNLQPKIFQFADNPGRQYSGLIAQDVEQVAPELVVTGSDGHKQVKYGDIQWLTLEAVKELKAENEALKQRIEVLEDQMKI
jgi:hypothetical protein